MKKYAVMIDWKAAVKCKLDVEMLEAATLPEAMAEAEKKLTEDVYLINIMVKVGKVQRIDGRKETDYKEILTNRGNGWHNCDDEHCESPNTWIHAEYGKFDDWMLRI